MKLKLVLAVGFFALFGFMNQPFVPVPIRMTTYSLVYVPSILASGLTYWYFDSTIEAKNTILTTAAKSVVGWYATEITGYYGQLIIASIWSTELEEYWNSNDNLTCGTFLAASIIGPNLLVSLTEFQVIRALFMFYPYQVLDLNHDFLAYPIVVSVPIVAGILQMITYHYSGTLCNVVLVEEFASKLGIKINVENFLFPEVEFFFLFHFLILLAEACIRLHNNWKEITDMLKCTVCWWKRRNAVHPSTSQPSSENLLVASYLNLYKVGSFLLVVLCFVLVQLLHQTFNYKISANLVIADCLWLGLPIYWVNSPVIFDFIKLKCNQLKYSLGYF